MNRDASDPSAEAEIRALVDDWLRAVQEQDVDRIMSHYAPDLLAFDAVSRLQFRGRESYGKHWAECFAACPGPMLFELHQLHVEADGDLAFCHCLNRCGAEGEDGRMKTSWMRATVCYRRIDGRWQVVHEHISIPFDMQTGAVLFDLTP